MNHTENLTRYIANFVDELVCSGLTQVVISPGSRSTPLAILFSEHEKIKKYVLIDERSAAYFALGIAKETNKAVAIVCTSGTAAANYFPAIVEAYYARIPLVVLTADRPHELRGIGANQTINQMNMYGDFVKEFHEMAPPESTKQMLRYVRGRAARAVREAEHGNPGPVHLNFPFREPLLPDLSLENLWGENNGSCYNFAYEGTKRLDQNQLKSLYAKIADKQRGLIVCGSQFNQELGEQITLLSSRLKVPILADPLSQLRSGTHEKATIISTYDALFKSEQLRNQLKPDYIIRFGAMPLSKTFLFFLQEHEDVLQIVVEDYEDMREPTNHSSEFVFANGSSFCKELAYLSEHVQSTSDWLSKWQQMEEIASITLSQTNNEKLTEGEAVRELMNVIPYKSRVFVGNSMPIRDVDTFFFPTDKEIIVHANRGVSGIDGTVSSALGVAASTNQPVTLVIGDLSFYHDLNSLLAAKHYQLTITILLINNNGGGIFSFLPQSKEEKHFEALFGTPLDISFEKAISMYEGNYELVHTKQTLKESLASAYKKGGLSVIEVQTDRNENVVWHRELWEKLEQRLLNNE
ncbi:2-succinyl-5-enolpyruvyl-6-hydroxy-3-cyclohexene-1-carboxylic-acid synthase [Pseudogracilibacillus sp. SO30301A]|uniref:2-succinyl-5-enolpyruvyl-6-hydroxy-3- cyclohexene-1-carboxylic-acid synthase n=1 Tax=Pseudogracilibacillus sp. SO30301A TaxID=3098291 RepID=UPI00300DDAF1